MFASFTPLFAGGLPCYRNTLTEYFIFNIILTMADPLTVTASVVGIATAALQSV
jgi:hypothetical protein